MDTGSEIRLDTWLWAARLFKTRAIAKNAIAGAKVHLDQQRVKPSRRVKIGDCYHVLRGHETIEVCVVGLSQRRGCARLAQTLYQETDASVERRQREGEQRKQSALLNPVTVRRPNKQEVRKIRRFIQRSY